MQTLQPSLFAIGEPSVNKNATVSRSDLSARSFIDHCPGFLRGGDELLGELADALPWKQGKRVMWGKELAEPRLSTGMRSNGHPVVKGIADELSARYEHRLDAVFCNYYRDGADSVAWHGDRVGNRPRAVVAIVSIGAVRRFLVRPNGGGPSRRFDFASGDLLVMGGACQSEFEHCIPKVRHAGPRMSLTFRARQEPLGAIMGT